MQTKPRQHMMSDDADSVQRFRGFMRVLEATNKKQKAARSAVRDTNALLEHNEGVQQYLLFHSLIQLGLAPQVSRRPAEAVYSFASVVALLKLEAEQIMFKKEHGAEEALLSVIQASEKHGRFLVLRYPLSAERSVAYSLGTYVTEWLRKADKIIADVGPDIFCAKAMRVMHVIQVLLSRPCYCSLLREPRGKEATFRAYILNYFYNIVMLRRDDESAAKHKMRESMFASVSQTLAIVLRSIASVAPLPHTRDKLYERVFRLGVFFTNASSAFSLSNSSSSSSSSRFAGNVQGTREIASGLACFLNKHGVHTTDFLGEFASNFLHFFEVSHVGRSGMNLGIQMESLAVVAALARVTRQFPTLGTKLFGSSSSSLAQTVYDCVRVMYDAESSQRGSLQLNASTLALDDKRFLYLRKVAIILLELPLPDESVLFASSDSGDYSATSSDMPPFSPLSSYASSASSSSIQKRRRLNAGMAKSASVVVLSASESKQSFFFFSQVCRDIVSSVEDVSLQALQLLFVLLRYGLLKWISERTQAAHGCMATLTAAVVNALTGGGALRNTLRSISSSPVTVLGASSTSDRRAWACTCFSHMLSNPRWLKWANEHGDKAVPEIERALECATVVVEQWLRDESNSETAFQLQHSMLGFFSAVVNIPSGPLRQRVHAMHAIAKKLPELLRRWLQYCNCRASFVGNNSVSVFGLILSALRQGVEIPSLPQTTIIPAVPTGIFVVNAEQNAPVVSGESTRAVDVLVRWVLQPESCTSPLLVRDTTYAASDEHEIMAHVHKLHSTTQFVGAGVLQTLLPSTAGLEECSADFLPNTLLQSVQERFVSHGKFSFRWAHLKVQGAFIDAHTFEVLRESGGVDGVASKPSSMLVEPHDWTGWDSSPDRYIAHTASVTAVLRERTERVLSESKTLYDENKTIRDITRSNDTSVAWLQCLHLWMHGFRCLATSMEQLRSSEVSNNNVALLETQKSDVQEELRALQHDMAEGIGSVCRRLSKLFSVLAAHNIHASAFRVPLAYAERLFQDFKSELLAIRSMLSTTDDYRCFALLYESCASMLCDSLNLISTHVKHSLGLHDRQQMVEAESAFGLEDDKFQEIRTPMLSVLRIMFALSSELPDAHLQHYRERLGRVLDLQSEGSHISGVSAKTLLRLRVGSVLHDMSLYYPLAFALCLEEYSRSQQGSDSMPLQVLDNASDGPWGLRRALEHAIMELNSRGEIARDPASCYHIIELLFLLSESPGVLLRSSDCTAQATALEGVCTLLKEGMHVMNAACMSAFTEAVVVLFKHSMLKVSLAGKGVLLAALQDRDLYVRASAMEQTDVFLQPFKNPDLAFRQLAKVLRLAAYLQQGKDALTLDILLSNMTALGFIGVHVPALLREVVFVIAECHFAASKLEGGVSGMLSVVRVFQGLRAHYQPDVVPAKDETTTGFHVLESNLEYVLRRWCSYSWLKLEAFPYHWLPEQRNGVPHTYESFVREYAWCIVPTLFMAMHANANVQQKSALHTQRGSELRVIAGILRVKVPALLRDHFAYCYALAFRLNASETEMYDALEARVTTDVFNNCYHIFSTEIIMQMISCVAIGKTDLCPECDVTNVINLLRAFSRQPELDGKEEEQTSLHSFLCDQFHADRFELIVIHVRQLIMRPHNVPNDRFKLFDVFLQVSKLVSSEHLGTVSAARTVLDFFLELLPRFEALCCEANDESSKKLECLVAMRGLVLDKLLSTATGIVNVSHYLQNIVSCLVTCFFEREVATNVSRVSSASSAANIAKVEEDAKHLIDKRLMIAELLRDVIKTFHSFRGGILRFSTSTVEVNEDSEEVLVVRERLRAVGVFPDGEHFRDVRLHVQSLWEDPDDFICCMQRFLRTQAQYQQTTRELASERQHFLLRWLFEWFAECVEREVVILSEQHKTLATYDETVVRGVILALLAHCRNRDQVIQRLAAKCLATIGVATSWRMLYARDSSSADILASTSTSAELNSGSSGLFVTSHMSTDPAFRGPLSLDDDDDEEVETRMDQELLQKAYHSGKVYIHVLVLFANCLCGSTAAARAVISALKQVSENKFHAASMRMALQQCTQHVRAQLEPFLSNALKSSAPLPNSQQTFPRLSMSASSSLSSQPNSFGHGIQMPCFYQNSGFETSGGHTGRHDFVLDHTTSAWEESDMPYEAWVSNLAHVLLSVAVTDLFLKSCREVVLLRHEVAAALLPFIVIDCMYYRGHADDRIDVYERNARFLAMRLNAVAKGVLRSNDPHDRVRLLIDIIAGVWEQQSIFLRLPLTSEYGASRKHLNQEAYRVFRDYFEPYLQFETIAKCASLACMHSTSALLLEKLHHHRLREQSKQGLRQTAQRTSTSSSGSKAGKRKRRGDAEQEDEQQTPMMVVSSTEASQPLMDIDRSGSDTRGLFGSSSSSSSSSVRREAFPFALLAQSCSSMGDTDGMYGALKLDSADEATSSYADQSTMILLEYEARWDAMLPLCDARLRDSFQQTRSDVARYRRALVSSLRGLGCIDVLDRYLDSMRQTQPELYQAMTEHHYECAWRTSRWALDDEPIVADAASSEQPRVHVTVFHSLKALSQSLDTRVGINASLVRRKLVSEANESMLDIVRVLALENPESQQKIGRMLGDLELLEVTKKVVETCVTDTYHAGAVEGWQSLLSLHGSSMYATDHDAAQFTHSQPLRDLVGALFGVTKQYKELAAHSIKCIHAAKRSGHVEAWEAAWRTANGLREHMTPLERESVRFLSAELCGARGDAANAIRLCRQTLHRLQDLKQRDADTLRQLIDASCFLSHWLLQSHTSGLNVVEETMNTALGYTEDLQDPEYSCKTHYQFARILDRVYQSLVSKRKFFEFERRFLTHDKLKTHIDTVKSELTRGGKDKHDVATKAIRRHVSWKEREYKRDDIEIQQLNEQIERCLEHAVLSYLKCLQFGESHNDVALYRSVGMWFDHSLEMVQNHVVHDLLAAVPSRKFVPVIHQVASRLTVPDASKPTSFANAVYALVRRMTAEHPAHCLLQIFALQHAESRETAPRKVNRQSINAARELLRELSTGALEPVIRAHNILLDAYIKLGEKKKEERQNLPRKGLRKEAIAKIKTELLEFLPVLTARHVVDEPSESRVMMAQILPDVSLAGGINAALIIRVRGTDGREYPQLVKSNDDMRQDAVMEQLFGLVNTLLTGTAATRQRALLMRTYIVVPITPAVGLVGMVCNTESFYNLFINHGRGLHERYWQGPAQTSAEVRNAIRATEETMRFDPDEMDEASFRKELPARYERVCRAFPPVMHHWFHENSSSNGELHRKRVVYSRSVAVSCIVGYIVGLGDRHLNNILIDVKTAEVVHIDLGVAFENGKLLKIPEIVPFRLTREFVDGMGISGYEGTFRRCAEETMKVLRTNTEMLITVLEVFLHDPLQDWTISPAKMRDLRPDAAPSRARHDRSASRGGGASDSDDTEEEDQVNQHAQRAIFQVKQKLRGSECGNEEMSVEGQISSLIADATSPSNLCMMFRGWMPWY